MHRLSTMSYYSLYMPEQALAQIKQCISFDPENKLCKALFRKLKTTEKEMARLNGDLQNGRWAGVINKSVGGEKSLVKNIETETTTMEEVNNAKGKMPKRLLLKVYSAACKGYTEVNRLEPKKKGPCVFAIVLEKKDVTILTLFWSCSYCF